MTITLLLPDGRMPEPDVERAAAGPDVTLLYPQKDRFEDIAAADWARADGIVVSRLPHTAEMIPALERCRIVVRQGVGFDVVDLEAYGAAGIAVCNVPDYGTTEVADTAIAMMLSFARGTTTYHTALRSALAESWKPLINVTARRLRGACLGVIGLGRIGTAAARRGRGFDMDVVFYDPHQPPGVELAQGLRRARTLDELLGQADVITIHTPLTRETRGMIDAKAVAAMKQDAWVINTSRGPVCDTGALADGLKSGKLAAVGLDVLPKEPATTADPLIAAWQRDEPWTRGRVLFGPHAGFYSPDAQFDMRTKAVQTAIYYIRDGTLVNCVNGEFLKNRR